MNSFDMLDHIAHHARTNGLDDHFEHLHFGTGPTLELHEGDVALFVKWARHLQLPTIRATPGIAAYLSVDGHMQCGHRIEVVVTVPTIELEARHLRGIVSIGQVTPLIHAGTVTA